MEGEASAGNCRGAQRDISSLQSTFGSLGSSPFYLLHMGKDATSVGVMEEQFAMRKVLDSVLQFRELAYEVFPDRQGR